MMVLALADKFLCDALPDRLPQPYGEWPEETISARLAACRKLAGRLPPGLYLRRLRRLWQGARAAALAAGWQVPRRSSASALWQPLAPPKPPRRAAGRGRLQPPEMAQPAAEPAENARQTLDFRGLCAS